MKKRPPVSKRLPASSITPLVSIFTEDAERRRQEEENAFREYIREMKDMERRDAEEKRESKSMQEEMNKFLQTRKSDPDFKKELREEMNRLMMGLPSSEAGKSILKSLVKIANDLDNRGLAQESDIIDSIISSCL